MSAAAVLDQCRVAGVSVWAEGGRLKFKAAAPLPDGLLDGLKAHKPGLLALLLAGAVNDHGTGEAASPVAITRELDPDRLTRWLRDEGLCLVLRDGLLNFTGPNTQGIGEPSAALLQHVEAHRAAIADLLTPLEVRS